MTGKLTQLVNSYAYIANAKRRTEKLNDLVQEAKRELFGCRNYYSLRAKVEEWFGVEE